MSNPGNIVIIGTSKGGIDALKVIVSSLPSNLAAAVFIVLHTGAHRSRLPQILGETSRLPVRHAVDHEPIRAGTVLIAPPDYHLLLEKTRVHLSHSAKENYARPAVDPLFRSAASHHGQQVIGIILTGDLDDGTVGLQAVKAHGGRAIVQDPAEAMAPDMPASALQFVNVDACLPLHDITPALLAMLQQPTSAPGNEAVAEVLAREEAFAADPSRGADELPAFASPSTYTCPECHGTLWQLHNEKPLRFRCHTGHSYTARVLAEAQEQAAEDALWGALRALQEKEKLYRQLASGALDGNNASHAHEYLAQAERADEQATTLRRLLTVGEQSPS